jgi:hypothetical protein
MDLHSNITRMKVCLTVKEDVILLLLSLFETLKKDLHIHLSTEELVVKRFHCSSPSAMTTAKNDLIFYDSRP